MKKEDFLKAIEKIKADRANAIARAEQRFKSENERVAAEYALSNNPHNVGDIIDFHSGGKLRIEKIEVENSVLSLPRCKYYGVIVKGCKTPYSIYRKGQHEYVYQRTH